MEKLMIAKLILLVGISSGVSVGYAKEREDVGSFYLKQVDYRHRGSFSLSIPGVARIRVRPSYEYRYKVKKKSVFVPKTNINQTDRKE
jgi:hypothetical protein